MTTISGCRVIVKGYGKGHALMTSQPINFLSMVATDSGRITDPKHELYRKSLKGNVLIFPHSTGSSVGAYVLNSLSRSGASPSAILCSQPDITTASGCAIANIPLLVIPHGSKLYQISKESILEVDGSRGTVVAKV